MTYVIALIIPPLGPLLHGRVFHALFNMVLFLLSILIFVGTLTFGSPVSFPLWLIAIIHALFIVHDSKTRSRIAAMRNDG